MSWSIDRAIIVNALPSGYVLIPENREPDSEDRPESHNHKAYSLKLKSLETEMLSADEMHYTHAVAMRVIYKAMDGTQLITNEELALTLMNIISNISGFVNYIEEPTIEEVDTKYIIFNLLFHFGQDDNLPFTMNINGSNDPTITLQGTESIVIDWGDDSTNTYNLTGTDQDITHTYSSGGTYTVKIENSNRITKFKTLTDNNYSFDLEELKKFNSAFYFLEVIGSNIITGNLSSISGLISLYRFYVVGENTISDYTTSAWLQTGLNYFRSQPASGSGLSSGEVDTILIDMDADITWTGSDKILWIAGNNSARTSASDAAVTSLEGKGVTVTTNE